MADAEPTKNPLRRPAVVRAGMVVVVFVAVGLGFAIGYAVHSPTTSMPSAACLGLGNYNTNSGVLCAVETPTKTEHATTTMPEPLITTSTTSPLRRILPPAVTEPVSDECSVPITHTADGNPNPAMCPGGDVNVLAWQEIAKTYPAILALGADATESQVFKTMCNVPNQVGGEVSLAADVAAAYYGWKFAMDLNNWYPGNPTYCSH